MARSTYKLPITEADSALISIKRKNRELTPWGLTWRRFSTHRMALLSGFVLATLIILAFAAPAVESLSVHNSFSVDLLNRFATPSPAHVLGTDELGRDVFLRMLHGGRVSLLVGLTTAALAAIFGIAIGIPAGYFGGWLDTALMRITDSVIALPLLPLLIVLAAVDLTKLGIEPTVAYTPEISLYRIILIIALVGWTTVARLVRGTALSLRQRDFVLASISQGASHTRIMFRHILPNSISPILVATTLSVGNIILLESVLSFLGLGIQPPMPSWGNMLTNAQELIYEAPMLAVWPGLAIFTTVVAFNFLGDGLQDAFDPKALTH